MHIIYMSSFICLHYVCCGGNIEMSLQQVRNCCIASLLCRYYAQIYCHLLNLYPLSFFFGSIKFLVEHILRYYVLYSEFEASYSKGLSTCYASLDRAMLVFAAR